MANLKQYFAAINLTVEDFKGDERIDTESKICIPEVELDQISQLIEDIEEGAGWCTDEYAIMMINELAPNPFSKDVRDFWLLTMLADMEMLCDEDLTEDTDEITKSALISVDQLWNLLVK